MTNEDFRKLEDKYDEIRAALANFDQAMFYAKAARYGFEDEKRITLAKLNDQLKDLAKVASDASALIESCGSNDATIESDPLHSDKAPVAVTSSDVEQSEIKQKKKGIQND